MIHINSFLTTMHIKVQTSECGYVDIIHNDAYQSSNKWMWLCWYHSQRCISKFKQVNVVMLISFTTMHIKVQTSECGYVDIIHNDAYQSSNKWMWLCWYHSQRYQSSNKWMWLCWYHSQRCISKFKQVNVVMLISFTTMHIKVQTSECGYVDIIQTTMHIKVQTSECGYVDIIQTTMHIKVQTSECGYVDIIHNDAYQSSNKWMWLCWYHSQRYQSSNKWMWLCWYHSQRCISKFKQVNVVMLISFTTMHIKVQTSECGYVDIIQTTMHIKVQTSECGYVDIIHNDAYQSSNKWMWLCWYHSQRCISKFKQVNVVMLISFTTMHIKVQTSECGYVDIIQTTKSE